MDDEPIRYEWSRPQLQPGASAGFPGAEHLVLPAPLELRVRRAVGPGEDAFEALPGAITLTLVPVPNPPPGHAPIAVRVEVSLSLRPVGGWDATQPDRRRRWQAGEEPSR